MKKDITELIDANGSIIDGSDKPSFDPKTSASKTTDQVVSATRQDTTQGYRRFYGEAVLPYTSTADRFADNPKMFLKFLQKHHAEDTFGQYFEKIDGNTKKVTNEEYLSKIVEDVLTKRKSNDLVSKRVFEDIESDNPFIVKYVKKLSEMMNDMDDDDKKLILGYLQKNG